MFNKYNAKQCAKLRYSGLRSMYVVSLTQIKIPREYLRLSSRSMAFRRDDSLMFRKRNSCVNKILRIHI